MAGKNRKVFFSVRDITLITILSSLLFIQEELLTFIPGLQFTVFLLIFYSKNFGFIRTTIIIIIHVLLDNMFMASFSFFYTPFMFLGWFFIPIITCSLFKKFDNSIILGFLGALSSFVYCWMFFIPDCLIYKVDFFVKFVSDFPFELLMAIMSFVSLFLFYKPFAKVIDPVIRTNTNNLTVYRN